MKPNHFIELIAQVVNEAMQSGCKSVTLTFDFEDRTGERARPLGQRSSLSRG